MCVMGIYIYIYIYKYIYIYVYPPTSPSVERVRLRPTIHEIHLNPTCRTKPTSLLLRLQDPSRQPPKLQAATGIQEIHLPGIQAYKPAGLESRILL